MQCRHTLQRGGLNIATNRQFDLIAVGIGHMHFRLLNLLDDIGETGGLINFEVPVLLIPLLHEIQPNLQQGEQPGHDNGPIELPILGGHGHVTQTHGDHKHINIDFLEGLFEFDWEEGLHLVVGVDGVLVVPVEVQHEDQHQDDDVGELERVEGDERPDFVQDHQLELDREGREGELLVQALLAHTVRLADLRKVFLAGRHEKTVPQVQSVEK